MFLSAQQSGSDYEESQAGSRWHERHRVPESAALISSAPSLLSWINLPFATLCVKYDLVGTQVERHRMWRRHINSSRPALLGANSSAAYFLRALRAHARVVDGKPFTTIDLCKQHPRHLSADAQIGSLPRARALPLAIARQALVRVEVFLPIQTATGNRAHSHCGAKNVYKQDSHARARYACKNLPGDRTVFDRHSVAACAAQTMSAS